MKDTEARVRVEELERAMTLLPAQVAEVVIAHYEPIIAQVNQALTALESQSARVDELVARVTSSGELLEVVESELNTMRVDINATRNATAAVSEAVANTAKRLDGLVSGLAGVASKVQS